MPDDQRSLRRVEPCPWQNERFDGERQLDATVREKLEQVERGAMPQQLRTGAKCLHDGIGQLQLQTAVNNVLHVLRHDEHRWHPRIVADREMASCSSKQADGTMSDCAKLREREAANVSRDGLFAHARSQLVFHPTEEKFDQDLASARRRNISKVRPSRLAQDSARKVEEQRRSSHTVERKHGKLETTSYRQRNLARDSSWPTNKEWKA